MASAKIIELTDENICKMCENALGKYSCPRCNMHYCSLSCYQSDKHLQCSEAFYRDCVFEDLKIQENDPDSKAKMLEILKRVHESNATSVAEENDESLDSDDDIFVDLGERLEGIDLDDAEKVWERLTSDERQDFESFIRSEDISDLIERWEPWWTYRSDKKISEVGVEEEYKLKCPKILDTIDPFPNLYPRREETHRIINFQGEPPSPCLKYNLINILGGYVFVARYFNGEHYDFAYEAVSTVIQLSLVLRDICDFQDAETALVSIQQECINSDWITIDQENVETVKEDVQKVMAGPSPSDKKFYMLSALSDFHHLIEVAEVSLENKQKKKNGFFDQFSNYEMPSAKLIPKKDLKKTTAKIKFYLSYVKYCLET